jgi:glutamate synthase (NADPH/NADH) small chain
MKEYSGICPNLNDNQALIESDRCYYCYDAPCIKACPTNINIPSFIARINQGNPVGAGEKILSDNIMGGTCARVCPVEILCEGSCVRTKNDKPVKIGLLQKYATDKFMAKKRKPKIKKSQKTDKHIAIVGAGPAGLSCAYTLSQFGHKISIYEKKEKGGGLNEYGLAPYKMIDDFAQKELQFILNVGKIKLLTNKKLGKDITLNNLRCNYDAVFLGLGLNGINELNIKKEKIQGVLNAVNFIENNRQNKIKYNIGKDVVVIGGGNTAIDTSIQAKLLGARNVTIFYRNGQNKMNATLHEQQFAKEFNVNIKYWLNINKIFEFNKKLESLEFLYTKIDKKTNKLVNTKEKLNIKCDTLFKAIGQKFIPSTIEKNSNEILLLENGKIKINNEQKTSLNNVFAGGDCANGGQDLTVQAVQDGKIAALAIHKSLTKQK